MASRNKNILITFLSLCVLIFTTHGSSSGRHKNVLFLAADDMRPNLGCYVNSHPAYTGPLMHTPHLDALAQKSLVFENAYSQQALCSPSRTSLLTGRRPDTTRVTDLVTYFREFGGNFTTIPQFFKDRGYYSVGGGKIFHHGMNASGFDDPISWTEKFHHAQNFYPHDHTHNLSWQALGPNQFNNQPLQDTLEAEYIIQKLREVAPNAKLGLQPFFLAFGVHKPHLPFLFPREYLDLYPDETINVPTNQYAPNNLPDIAWSPFGELQSYYDTSKDAIDIPDLGHINVTYPSHKVKELRRAYYSALSYADYSIGQVLTELKNLELEDDTIIVFWSDHGWQLGEHAEWCKHTNFEIAAHVPLMISIPGLTNNGVRSTQLVELVDIFSTLVEATGFQPLEMCPPDSSEVSLCTEGSSLIPLIFDPNVSNWKRAVFWQYPRGGSHNHIPRCMGYSIRTHRYHYTEWVSIKITKLPKYEPNWDEQCGHYELYDLNIDPEENINWYENEDYIDLKKDLSRRLRAGWRNEVRNQSNEVQVTIDVV